MEIYPSEKGADMPKRPNDQGEGLPGFGYADFGSEGSE
jgi:hypothetical protein